MTGLDNRREYLTHYCASFVDEQISHVQNAINLAKESAQSEQKSSAGDKHETGKSLMQLEQENNSLHLQKMLNLQRVIPMLQSFTPSETVKLGSIVETTIGIYFVALGIGKVTCEGKDVYVISPASPIGKLLLSKKSGDVVKFQNQQITITKVL